MKINLILGSAYYLKLGEWEETERNGGEGRREGTVMFRYTKERKRLKKRSLSSPKIQRHSWKRRKKRGGKKWGKNTYPRALKKTNTKTRGEGQRTFYGIGRPEDAL